MKRKIMGEKRYAYAPNAHNFVHVLLHENIDVEKLKKSIAILHKANPILNSLLYETKNGLEYNDIPFMMPEIIELERIAADTYKDVLREEERIPLNLHHNSSYRLIIIKDDEYTDLILMSHQLLIDEYSTITLLQSILMVYDTAVVTNFTYDNLVSMHLNMNKLDHLLLQKVKKEYMKDNEFLIEENYREKYFDYYRVHKTAFYNLNLSKDESHALIAYCERHNLDLYALIFTAFKASENKYQGNRSNKFKESLIAKNIRKDSNEFGNFNTLGFINFQYNASKSLIENTKQLMNCLAKCDYLSYYCLNNELELEAFKALENQKNISLSLKHFANKLGYWDYLMGSELSFANEIECRTTLAIERVDILRASHRLVEKNVSIVLFDKCIYITMQFNKLSTNSKDMKDIINNTKLILVDSIKE